MKPCPFPVSCRPSKLWRPLAQHPLCVSLASRWRWLSAAALPLSTMATRSPFLPINQGSLSLPCLNFRSRYLPPSLCYILPFNFLVFTAVIVTHLLYKIFACRLDGVSHTEVCIWRLESCLSKTSVHCSPSDGQSLRTGMFMCS